MKKPDLNKLVRDVFAADHAYVEATATLLRHFGAGVEGGLAFLFDRRNNDYRVTKESLFVTVNGKEVAYKHAPDPIEVDGCALADATGLGCDKDGVRLYLCDLNGFRVGVIVDPARESEEEGDE